MNKPAIKAHLKEAADQLAATLEAIDKKNFRKESLLIDLSHVYHHVNSAWNGKDCTPKQYRECSEKNFYRWRQFPSEEEMLLDRVSDKKAK
jgi:hypothetical protein